jgi:hypothetical protein
MARSVSIGELGLHNFRAGKDHIVCCYDDSKADKTGERCTDKHLYANQSDPTVCLFLALGIFFSLESLHLSKTEKLFQIEGQWTAASQRYCGQLTELFKSNAENLKAYIRAEHANSHGIRKGSAMAVTSGTTLPPPLQHHPMQPASTGPWGKSWTSIGILLSQEITTWVVALQVLIPTPQTLRFFHLISLLEIPWNILEFVRQYTSCTVQR